MNEQAFLGLPFMPDLRAVVEQNNDAMKRVFKGRKNKHDFDAFYMPRQYL